MIRIVSQGTALVTGAASGIGAIYAHRLARRGYDLILVDSRPLQTLAEWLKRDTRRNVEILAADPGTPSGLSAVEDRLILEERLTALVNNGSAGARVPSFSPGSGHASDLIARNVGVPARLAYAAAGGFAERGVGTIVNVAPVAPPMPAGIPGTEDGGKALFLDIGRVLHEELHSRGVRIQMVVPDAAASAVWHVAGDALEDLSQEVLLLAEAMVDQALAALDQDFTTARPSIPQVRDWEGFEKQAAQASFARFARPALVEIA
ncbi:SDR family NAD(P)-dependent oxidoreductase [Allosphingosinicella deserti]|nr:SDR family NAD(P)-dependent oxidoreductase [Sphingomonas deserti]